MSKKIGFLVVVVLVGFLILASATRWFHRYEREHCYAHRDSATTIVAEDLGGNSWEVLVEADDDFTRGWVNLVMDDNNTEDFIYDDIVIGYVMR